MIRAARRARWGAGESDPPPVSTNDSAVLRAVHELPADATRQRTLQVAYVLDGVAQPPVSIQSAPV